MIEETVEPGNALQCLQTVYATDDYGNRWKETTGPCAGYTGRAVEARETTRVFADRAETDAPGPNQHVAGAYETGTTNAMGHGEQKFYDIRFGAVSRLIGPNGLATTVTYDGFGRPTLEVRADGAQTRTEYFRCPGAARCLNFQDSIDDVSFDSGRQTNDQGASVTIARAQAISAYYVETTPLDKNSQQSGPKAIVHFDALNREIAKETQSYDGAWVRQITAYDFLGLPAATYSAHFATETDLGKYRQWTARRDLKHRPLEARQFPREGDNAAVTTRIEYRGLETVTFDPMNRRGARRMNAAGLVAQTVDAYQATVNFAYDAVGGVLKTVDALGNEINTAYAYPRAFKVALNDPDKGAWTYEYDTFGQLRSQTNAKSQTSTMEYDRLGRLKVRTDLNQNSEWSYDRNFDATPCGTGIGKLCEARTNTAFNRKFTYDTQGRPSTTVTSLGCISPTNPTAPCAPGSEPTAEYKIYTSSVAYDDASRVERIVYPTGFSVRNRYRAITGFLQRVENYAAPGQVYWSIDSLGAQAPFDAKGNLLRQRFGDPGNVASVQTFHDYDRVTGRQRQLRTGIASGVYGVQDTGYEYDNLQNLKRRNDRTEQNLQEEFLYDDLNRLETHTLSSPAMGTRTVSVKYNALGNVLWKSDVGSYLYAASGPGTVRPHAVVNAAGTNYLYDANGNLESTTGNQARTHVWTSFNLPQSMGMNGKSMAWLYDANYQRVESVVASGGATRRVHMIHPDNAGGLFFEKETVLQGGSTTVENRHYIVAVGGVIGVVKTYGDNNGSAPSTAAGIPDAVANQTQYWHKDHLGSIVAVTNARGVLVERMAFDAWGKRMQPNGREDFGSLNPAHGDRGFTGHEHLDELGLVHMNGRIYDPKLGRFFSPDNFVQAPELLQNYNRFSYVLNNPLTYTDPSGQFVEWVALFIVGAVMASEGNQYWRIVGSILMAYSGYEVGFAALTESGLTSSIAATKVAASGLSGFASGLVTSGGDIGAAIHEGAFAAITTGVGLELRGTTRIVAHAVIQCVRAASSGGNCGPAALAAAFSKFATPSGGFSVEGFVVTAIVGGTASVIGGGKFASGASTAAFVYLYNECASTRRCSDWMYTGVNTRVLAVETGVVSDVGWQDPKNQNAGFGFRIKVTSIDGQRTWIYAHMDPNTPVFVDMLVSRGDQIGNYAVPANGNSTGPHLHLEVRSTSTNQPILNQGDVFPIPGGRMTSPINPNRTITTNNGPQSRPHNGSDWVGGY